MRFLVLIALLAGCVSVNEKPAGPQTHELATAVGFLNNYGGAQIALDSRASELCPAGYERVAEKRAGDDLVWTVRCD